LNRDQGIGSRILFGSVAGIAAYVWLIYEFSAVVSLARAFLAVAAVLVIPAWIGLTKTTRPPPKPIEFEASPVSGSKESPCEGKAPRFRTEP